LSVKGIELLQKRQKEILLKEAGDWVERTGLVGTVRGLAQLSVMTSNYFAANSIKLAKKSPKIKDTKVKGAGKAKANTIDDILDTATENTTQKGVAKNYVKSGGYDTAVKDFDSLNLNNVKDIQTKYGPGKVGYTSDGAKVVVRTGSSAISGGAPTLEIKISNSKIHKVRY